MLQNDFEYCAGQFRPEPLRGHKFLVYKTNLDRATAHIKAQDTVRTLADRLPQYFHDVVATGLKGLYTVPHGSPNIGGEAHANRHRENQNSWQP